MFRKKMQEEKDLDIKVVRKKRTYHKTPVNTLNYVSIGDMSLSVKRPGLFMFTLMVINDYLYLLGITLMRRYKRIFKRAKLVFQKIKGHTYALLYELGGFLSRLYRRVVKRFESPFIKLADYYNRQKPLIEKDREEGRFPATPYFNIAWYAARMLLQMAYFAFSYIAPVAAAFFLFAQIEQSQSVLMGLKVSYLVEGEEIVLGYVKSETDYENATKNVRDRLITTGDYNFVSSTPKFELEQIPSESVITAPEDLATKIIQASGVEIQQAYGFYVNGKLLGALEDKRILDELESIQKKNASGKMGERFDFDKSIALKPGLYPKDSVVELEQVKKELHRNDIHQEAYTVQKGDTPTGIADRFGISYELFKEMNPGIEKTLQVGDEVITAVARPYLSVKSIYTDIYHEEFNYEVVEAQNATYAKGYRQVDKPGVKGLRQVTAEITTVNGIEVDRQVLNTQVIIEQIPERVTVGVNNPQRNTGSGQYTKPGDVIGQSNADFIWPTSGGYISCYLGGYPGHTGIDIADKAGAPIYAAASGTVKISKPGWTAYGHYIVIDHGNGYETLYAHNSVLYVNVGDFVEQGQVIALMGRTGRASGNHVHFEVKYKGKVQNPVRFVGDRRRR